jgi:DNA-binding NarL/FixJ family response regulator
VRVAIADDVYLFREGLALVLERAGIGVSVQAASGEELIERLGDQPPDAVVLDIKMPKGVEGIDTAHVLRRRFPRLGILVLSQYIETPFAESLFRNGTAGIGYLLKDVVGDLATLEDALQRVCQGQPVLDSAIVDRLFDRDRQALASLTDRELEVLHSMAEGRSNEAIRAQLSLSVKTIERHTTEIFRKLGVANDKRVNPRVLAVVHWFRNTPSSWG